jgi:23S rRNA pseudouridine1911/1915/1917 synthase
MSDEWEVVYQDNHLLVINKPAGVLSQNDETGDTSVVELAKAYLKRTLHKPGNVYVGLVHRLDRPVSGVLVLARTSKAAARLARQFRDSEPKKLYWTWVEGPWPGEAGDLRDRLVKDEATRRVRLATTGDTTARLAHLAFRVLERRRDATLLELRPTTGRGHQLRVQLASRGFPIAGDLKYGSRRKLAASDGGARIALHARSLALTHPTTRVELEFLATAPADWPEPEQFGPLVGRS